MIEGDRYVALLRGLNVGGHHKVNMADLREMFSSPQLSFSDVQTYIQSGNVVFSTPPVSPASPTSRAMMLQDQIEVAFEERFGFPSPVVVRDAPQLRSLIERNPFLSRNLDPAKLHVYFLASDPSPSAVALLDPTRWLPDEFVVDGRHIYVHFVNGAGRSKISFNLGTAATARNWNTVSKLVAML